MEFLAKQRREMKLDDHDLYIGLSSKLRWIWLDGENVSNGYNLWGPGQPDGSKVVTLTDGVFGQCGATLACHTFDFFNIKFLI